MKTYVKLTNGFGNNIFQYVAAKLLHKRLNSEELIVIPYSKNYYAIDSLKELGISCDYKLPKKNFIHVGDGNYDKAQMYNGNDDLLLEGYFEDYRYYYPNLDLIKSWFPEVKPRKDNDLVVHFRTGDRLFMRNEFFTKPGPKQYLQAIRQFNFDRLHIVTDMPKWGHVSSSELRSMKFHNNVPDSERVDINLSVDYFNSFVDMFSEFSPVIEKGSILEDFNKIRSFRNILFEHGTLGWWASVLSGADKVGVYGPWRQWKGDKNKNLSNIPMRGWFKWE